ncbi:MAG TPA: MFS transporter, partial [Candidatus Limnocylindria bacterium]|jgi:MFS family permease|nr:MFS transporter [Candidatus Limnocylindria bacterium]
MEAPANATAPVTTAVPWYRVLDRRRWATLAAANLGWLFDGYETYALILTVAVALHQLVAPAQYKAIPFYAGVTIAITLLGWGIGGIVGGIVADYIGRKKMMIIAILAYSLVTGLTAFAWSWTSFVLLRFLVGVALGSEWGTGTSMMAEMWPDGTRGKGAGLMQCGLGIGFFLASAVWFFVSGAGPSAWRWMFIIGVLPALATLWVRRGIEEPALWKAADQRRRDARAALQRGEKISSVEEQAARFTLSELFADPKARKYTIFALLGSMTTTLGWWGISSWVPPYVGSLAATHGLAPGQWASLAGMVYNAGAIAGYIGCGFFADKWGRKPVTFAFFALSLLLTPVLFLWTHDLTLVLIICVVNGFFTLGQYTWMPTWLPEIYPTRIRATAIAVAFNAPRFVAFLGPLVAGTLITHFGGYGEAATIVGLIYIVGMIAVPFLPETHGKPLPDA